VSFISVIIPAKDEEDNILSTLTNIETELDNNRIHYEIIVVNDGSQDATEEIVRKAHQRNPQIRVVNNHPPCGIGYAVRKGLEEFKGDMVVIAMADACDDPQDMLQYIRHVQEGYDCCFGNRWGKEVTIQGYPKFKLFCNRLVNWGIRFLFQIPYADVTNAFKCYSRRTIEGINPILSRHFNITVELPLKAIVRGYSYAIIPTNWYNNRRGESHLKLKEMGSRYLFIIIYIFLEKLLCGGDYKKT